MSNRLKYEALATVGEYTNAQGEKKKRYAKCGVVFEDDQGRLSLKLDTVPIGPGWSGYIQFFEPRRDGAAPAQQSAPRSQPQQSTGRYAETADLGDGDDIPF